MTEAEEIPSLPAANAPCSPVKRDAQSLSSGVQVGSGHGLSGRGKAPRGKLRVKQAPEGLAARLLTSHDI